MLAKYFALVIILVSSVPTWGNNPGREFSSEQLEVQNSASKRTELQDSNSWNSSTGKHGAVNSPKFWIRDNSDFATRNPNGKLVDERDKEFLAAIHEDLFQKYSDEQQAEQGWEEVRLVLHGPRVNSVTISLRGRELELEMVDSSGIVAPGAKLYRSPEAEPVPLLVRSACHYSLYSGTVRTGSLSTCHPLGPHAVLLVDGELIDIVPRQAIEQSKTPSLRPPSLFQQPTSPTLPQQHSTPLQSPQIFQSHQLPSPPHETPSTPYQPLSQTQTPSTPQSPTSYQPLSSQLRGPDLNGVSFHQNYLSIGQNSHVPLELYDRHGTSDVMDLSAVSREPFTFVGEEMTFSGIDENGPNKIKEEIARFESRPSEATQDASSEGRVSEVSAAQPEDPEHFSFTWAGHLAKSITKTVADEDEDDGFSVQPRDLVRTSSAENAGNNDRRPQKYFGKSRKRRSIASEPSHSTRPETQGLNSLSTAAKHSTSKRYYSQFRKSKLTLEVALFLDAVLLDNLFSFYTEDQLINLILSLMNNAQSFFHQESLGRQLDLSITQLYLLRTQPTDLPTHDGDRLKLLESFCAYQKVRAHPSDSSPLNWDLAVYLSGLDLITRLDNGGVSDVTMGLTYTGGVCDLQRSCIISEFSTTNVYGRPFPSAGALTSLILTHEIGHSLGLRHDGSNNTCTGQNNIMAAGRGPRGGTTWSRCSREAFAEQNGRCLWDSGKASVWDEAGRGLLPGQRFDAVSQCQLFFRDHDATLTWPSNLKKLCNSVQCSSPHRLTSYLAGPALEGTYCGGASWCRGGKCIPWTDKDRVNVTVGGLGQWEEGPCTSACLAGGTGWRESRRPCSNPAPQNSDKGCITTSYKTDFCDDKQVCGTRRRNMTVALAELCERVAERYPDAKSEGEQQKHDPTEPWLACVLYCRLHSNESQLWTPRYLFQDDPTVPTHLPPGAPCHTDTDGTVYRCYHRTCVPHTERFTVAVSRDTAGLFEYRDPPSLDDLVIKAGPPVNDPLGDEDYPEFDLDDLY